MGPPEAASHSSTEGESHDSPGTSRAPESSTVVCRSKLALAPVHSSQRSMGDSEVSTNLNLKWGVSMRFT